MKQKQLLYTNIDFDEDEYRELYKENTEEEIVNDADFYSWLDDALSLEFEDFMMNLKYSKYNNTKCVILGSLGLWYGNREIEPVKEETLLEAIKKCLNCTSAYYVSIYKVYGHIEVELSHHDGRNVFEIHLLNNKGYDTIDGDLSNRRYHKAIKDYLF